MSDITLAVGDRVHYTGPDQKQMHGPLEGVVYSVHLGYLDINCFVQKDDGDMFFTSHQYLERVEENNG